MIDKAGKNLSRFFLQNDGYEAQIRFLTEEPINFYEHNVKGAGNQFKTKICTGADCPSCAQNDRPSFKSALRKSRNSHDVQQLLPPITI